MTTVCIDVANSSPQAAQQALNMAMRLGVENITMIGASHELQADARNRGCVVTVLPAGSAVPDGVTVLPNQYAAYEQLDKEVFPAVVDCLENNFIVVLIGAPGTGKTDLAKKALPSARVITGLDGPLIATGTMDSDMIVEGLYCNVPPPDESIRYRNQALARGHRIIFTSQEWEEVVPHLADIEQSQYKVFDLDRVWERHGRINLLPNHVPHAVLAN